MQTKIKISIITCLLLIVAVVTYFSFNYFNQVKVDTYKLETELYLNSENLIRSFQLNEIAANILYVEKVIEIKGKIKDIIETNSKYTVVLQGENEYVFILCDILPQERYMTESFELGQTISLKGVCKGYLNDVIMLNCIVVNKKTNE